MNIQPSIHVPTPTSVQTSSYAFLQQNNLIKTLKSMVEELMEEKSQQLDDLRVALKMLQEYKRENEQLKLEVNYLSKLVHNSQNSTQPTDEKFYIPSSNVATIIMKYEKQLGKKNAKIERLRRIVKGFEEEVSQLIREKQLLSSEKISKGNVNNGVLENRIHKKKRKSEFCESCNKKRKIEDL